MTLVTGAGGMVGSHMVELFYAAGKDVVGLYYNPTVDMWEINSEIRMIECDVRCSQSVQQIVAENMPDRIYHLAAQSYPTVSWERPYETMDININGTIAVFEAIKKIREVHSAYDPVVVVACSSAEYGAAFEKLNEPKIKETAELLPLHPYGVSKVAQDLLAYQYFVNDSIRTIRARIFNTTGTRKINDVVSDFTRRAVEQEKAKVSILRVGNVETHRAIMDVRDLVSALELLAENGEYGEAYNISASSTIQVKQIISIIEKVIGKAFDVSVDDKLLRSSDEKVIIGNTEKLVKDTGWRQTITFEETVAEMINYWRQKCNISDFTEDSTLSFI